MRCPSSALAAMIFLIMSLSLGCWSGGKPQKAGSKQPTLGFRRHLIHTNNLTYRAHDSSFDLTLDEFLAGFVGVLVGTLPTVSDTFLHRPGNDFMDIGFDL